MLLDSSYTIIPQIRFTLTYDSGIRKVITVKTKDTISCSYKKNGERLSIVGIVTKIGCNFNSSLGAVGTTAYIQIDGSSEYSGEVVYIQPSQVLDLTIISTSGTIDNVVCSVDNDTQKITLIRQNEVGVFQYSLDGITWKAAVGAQGMSAYECAVSLGYVGSEAEWIASLKGEKGDTGETGGVEIYKVYHSVAECLADRANVPKGKLVTVIVDETSYLYIKVCKCTPCSESCSKCSCGCCNNATENSAPEIKCYDYVGVLTVGPKGDKGDPGKSAYESAVEGGYTGTEDDFIKSLARTGVAVTNYYSGPCGTLKNTVVGPMDLRVFGYTDKTTLVSKSITRIDVNSVTPSINQTLLFPDPVILRAVPTTNEGAKPNIEIGGVKYIADCIMNYNGQVGVYRRVKVIESYNGETIIGDWISSTGELDLGAKVLYTYEGTFEPFSELVQSQYRKLSTYDGSTEILTTESTYISVVYAIAITDYIGTYIQEHKEDIIVPIVEEVVKQKIDLPEGETITSYVVKKITDVVGVVPEGKTVIQLINEVSASITDILNNKIGDIPEGVTVAEAIKAVSDSIEDIVDNKIGTLPEGKTVIQITNDLETKVTKNTTDISTVSSKADQNTTDISNLTTKVNTNTTNISNVDTKVTNLTSTVNGHTTDINDLKSKIAGLGDKTVTEYIDASIKYSEPFVTTKEVGGIAAGTTITTEQTLLEIVKQILCPTLPPVEEVVYVGVNDNIPTDLSGLTTKSVEFATLTSVSNRYTANNQHLVFAYTAESVLEELVSIKDGSGFEQIDGWSHFTYNNGSHDFYIYYSNEAVTVSSFKLTFVFVDE